jgi:hypothetical protein
MTLERWVREQDKKGNARAAGLGNALLQEFGDTPLIDKNDFAAVLKKETKEFKKDLFNPEKATAFWQAFWNKNGNKIDFAVNVTPCPIEEEQIRIAAKSGIGLIFVPEGAATQLERPILGKMFPKMHNLSVRPEDNEVRNIDSHSGWRFFDMQAHPLVPGTTEPEVRLSMQGRHAEAATLNEYIIASQAAKVLTGKYLDEAHYYSRLIGSVFSGDTIVARFAGSGELDVVPWKSDRYASRVGARFSFPAV